MFFGTTGFGQPAQQPAPAFGAQPASPFGAAFGQPSQPAASPFGATASSAPLFGSQTPAPAFGAAAPSAAPSFGATTSTTGFGTGAFGAAPKPAGFGGFGTTTTAAPNPFGTTTQSAPAFGGFGAASAPAFGAPAAAPANPFGATTTGFGATAAPAFGAAAPATTGFGAPAAPAAAPFGSTTTNLFGAPAASPSPFGAAPTQPTAGFGGFGAAPAPAASTNGTRNVPYSKTKDPDVPAGQPATFLMSMSSLPNFQAPNPAKSHEELRWEDYQEGVKNQSAGPAPTAAGAFGAPAPTAGFGGFGATTQSATTGFGATAQANPFSAPASQPTFGATAAPTFGATQSSLFGTTPANPFGTTAASVPAFGGFGAPPAAASQPSLFGGPTTTGFGTGSAFGPATPSLGAASSAASFSFTSSPSTYGAASAPATSLFGTAAPAASSPFGATNPLGAVGSPFGPASSASAFGTSTFGAFGATTAKPASPFGAPTATPPFGTAAPAATGGGLFGGTAFGTFASQPASSPSLFGAAPGGSTMSFGTGLFSAPASAPATGAGLFGMPAVGIAPAAPVQPPTVAQPAYGNFGSLPAVPDAKVGITARAARNTSISSGASKASPLLSLRPTPVRYGASVRARPEAPFGLGLGATGSLPTPAALPVSAIGVSAGSDLLTPQAPGGTGANGVTAAAASAAVSAVGGTGLLPLRPNPHRLFIAAPPPSTEAAGGVSFLSPSRPASVHRGATPDGGAGGAGDDVGGLHGADGAAAAETPAAAGGRHGGGTGLNGYATAGYGGGSAAAAATAAGGGPAAAGGRSAAAAAPAAATFQDAGASEAHLPRLGRLVADGYSFSPNVDELRLLHSQNPENLAAVSNFTIARAGIGQIRWVVPVDVRGMALYDIVSLEYGDVTCYPDDSTKPPLGQGLNKPAEITLYGVYRKDKETGAPLTEGPRGQAYEKVLRQACAKMGAKFLSYKLDGGVWKFEVEHFSRYGLMDIDEDDEDEGPEAAGGAGAALRAGAPAAPPMPEEGVGEAPGAVAGAGQRRAGGLGFAGNADGEFASSPLPVGRGLAGAGLRGFALRGAGGPAASAAGRAPGPLLVEDSEMEPSVGIRRPPLGELPEAGSSETTGLLGADQDMSEARAQLRFGDDPAVEAEVSAGVVGPAAPGAGFGGGGGSTVTGSLAAAPPSEVGLGLPPMMDGGHTSVPIQHALPASLALDPVQTRALHEAFFGDARPAVSRDGGVTAMANPYGYRQAGGAAAAAVRRQAGAAGPGMAPVGASVGGAAAAEAAARGRAAAASRAGGPGPARTTWRRPGPALASGAPAAVMARGAALISSADASADGSSGSGGGGNVSPLSISLALARPGDMNPAATMAEGALSAVRPLRDLRTASCLTDAGLAMGRSFRVGWGPGGRLVVPGAADATSATEICVTRVRVEGEGSAYGEVSYGSGARDFAGSEEAERLEALRDRLRAALEIHLAASKPIVTAQQADGPEPGLAADGMDAEQQQEQQVDAAAGVRQPIVPYWRLCVDSRELAVLVDRYVRVAEAQVQQLLGGAGGGAAGAGGGDAAGGGYADADNPEVLRLRHEIDTWRLVQVLFARIDGEVPEAGLEEGSEVQVGGVGGGEAEAADGGATPAQRRLLLLPAPGDAAAGAAGADTEMMVLSTPPSAAAAGAAGAAAPDQDMAGGSDEDPTTAATAAATAAAAAATRMQLAALQRRAQLGLWLQRQARRRVEEDLASAANPSVVVLHLLAAHQLGAAVGAAVAAGDPRLAMLIARAGSRASARSQLAAQLAIWQRTGFPEHMAPERLAAYHLLAGQVLEAQRLLSLDWRRRLGLNLWYSTPANASPMAAVKQYLMDRHVEPAAVPHPAPYHAEGLQPSATGAAPGGSAAAASALASTDVQWELLQLWSTTPAAAAVDCLAAGQKATRAGVEAAAARAREAWLAAGGGARLLRCSGYSSNPLDHSLAWYLMTLLQATGVLPDIAPSPSASSTAADGDDSPPAAFFSRTDRSPTAATAAPEMLATTLEFISQLLLAGGLCEWALYVAMTIPDLAGAGGDGAAAGNDGGDSSGGSSGAVRQRVVRELLAVTAPEWMSDSSRESFLTSTLRIPAPLLAEARAIWAHYTRDDAARCAALLAAGQTAAAHELFAAVVAPGLFLAGAWAELSRLIEALEPTARGLSGWDTGGGLYGNFLGLFGRQLLAASGGGSAAAGLTASSSWAFGGASAAAAGSGSVVPEGVSAEEIVAFAQQVQRAQEELAAEAQPGNLWAVGGLGGGPSGSAAAAAPSAPSAATAAEEAARMRRRLVLARLASRVLAVCTSAGGAPPAPGAASGAAAATSWRDCAVLLQAGLMLPGCVPSELQLGGVAVAVAAVGQRVMCRT